MFYSTQPQPVTQADPTIILDQNFAANAMDEMRKLGAKNAYPPLAPSTHLKNVQTGVIFPWSPGLAEMRDILVNCDADGNTDPAAWQKTVRDEGSLPNREELMQEAYANLRRPQGFMQESPAQQNAPAAVPPGVQSLDKYLDSINMTPESEAVLTQLGSVM